MKAKQLARISGVLFVVLALVLGCGKAEQEAQPEEEAKTYSASGRIVALDSASVTISHGEIPGLMAAMTMKFPVQDPQLLTGLAEGDSVNFTLTVKGNEYLVTGIEKVAAEGEEQAAEPESE